MAFKFGFAVAIVVVTLVAVAEGMWKDPTVLFKEQEFYRNHPHHLQKRQIPAGAGSGFAGQLCVLGCNQGSCPKVQGQVSGLKGEDLIKKCLDACTKLITDNEVSGRKAPEVC